MKRETASMLAIAIAALAAGGPLFGQTSSFTFTKVVDTSMAPSGGPGNFTDFGTASLDGGVVAFSGVAGSFRGIYTAERTSSAYSIQTVADTNTLIPGQSVNFASLFGPVISGRTVAFQGSEAVGAASFEGIYSNRGGTLGVIVQEGMPIPGGLGTFGGQAGSTSIDNGEVVFVGFDSFGSGAGIFKNSGGSVTTVIPRNGVVPATSIGGYAADTFTSPDIDGGSVAFVASNGVHQGAYISTGGVVTKVRDSIQGVVGFQGTRLDNGVIAYEAASASSGTQAIYVDNSPVAVQGAPAPGMSGTIADFPGVTLSLDAGRVAFGAQTSLGTHAVFTNLTGTLEKVLAQGDLLDGKTVSLVTVSANSLSGGDLALNVRFTDSSRGVYLASFAPTDLTLVVDPDTSGGLLGGASHLGGLDYAFDGATPGTFEAAFSVTYDTSLLQPGVSVGDGAAFQLWNLSFLPDSGGAGTGFDSVLLTLNYNPLLIDGDLKVYHQFDNQAILLTQGTLGSLGLNQYAIAGNGLLQVRIGHFSDIVVTGSSGDAEPGVGSSAPEPGSLAIFGVLAIAFGCCRNRRARANPA